MYVDKHKVFPFGFYFSRLSQFQFLNNHVVSVCMVFGIIYYLQYLTLTSDNEAYFCAGMESNGYLYDTYLDGNIPDI